jgi:plastocyanin
VAGQSFTIRFTNNDPITHDFAVYTHEGGDLIARSDLITGPGATSDILVPALQAGTYFFRCDPHADHMEGVLLVRD